MSMMARFVAITPDQLATIKDKPEMVGGVFALDAGRPLESPSDLQDRLRRQAPQLVADMLERLPPAVRQQLRQKLGLGEKGLPNSGNNNELMLQLAQREAARRRARPAPRPQHLTRQGVARATLPLMRRACSVSPNARLTSGRSAIRGSSHWPSRRRWSLHSSPISRRLPLH